ncbi:MAG: hypothetical protein HC771_05605 [Synechococcales cyanobacterium CRU_2_2]|nr:hypothetical protein [Synechococcales cyanobacterium CRU_2_2]
MDFLSYLCLCHLRRSQPVRRWPARLVASALAAVLGGSGVLLLLPQSVQAQAEGLLSLGQTNRDVEALQQQLIVLGFWSASTPAGPAMASKLKRRCCSFRRLAVCFKMVWLGQRRLRH